MKKQTRDDIVARADDAFGSSSYAEFTVEKKVEGSYKFHRFLMVLAYILVLGGLAVFLAFKFTPVVAIIPILAWMVWYFTWKYVSIEYKYTIDHGLFTAFTVYGGKKESLLFSCRIKDFIRIAPDDEEHQADKIAFGEAKNVAIVSSFSSQDRYYALLPATDEAEKTILYFQATSQALKALKYYNSSALVLSEVSR